MTRLRLPDYLKKPIANSDEPKNKKVREILKNFHLNTVCDNARCPNKYECYARLTATFLIMGKNCTRNCKFCNISKCAPEEIDKNEPKNVALAIKELGLKYAVITSVTRDDLEDYGAEHFCRTIEEIRKINPDTKVEILTPDFKNNKKCLDMIINAKPDVFNHNIETVKKLYPKARQMANYEESLEVLKYVKDNSNIITKTGLMVGLGESYDELKDTFKDIALQKTDILTLGQYIAPSRQHLEVEKYYTQEEFGKLEQAAQSTGIKYTVFSPLARSSYKAYETYQEVLKTRL